MLNFIKFNWIFKHGCQDEHKIIIFKQKIFISQFSNFLTQQDSTICNKCDKTINFFEVFQMKAKGHLVYYLTF